MTWVFTAKARFYLHEGESLLDGLLRTGHKIEYQCREGYCGSCRVQVVSHSQPITYPFSPLAMIADDEILTCCCQVKGVLYIKEN